MQFGVMFLTVPDDFKWFGIIGMVHLSFGQTADNARFTFDFASSHVMTGQISNVVFSTRFL